MYFTKKFTYMIICKCSTEKKHATVFINDLNVIDDACVGMLDLQMTCVSSFETIQNNFIQMAKRYTVITAKLICFFSIYKTRLTQNEPT